MTRLWSTEVVARVRKLLRVAPTELVREHLYDNVPDTNEYRGYVDDLIATAKVAPQRIN